GRLERPNELTSAMAGHPQGRPTDAAFTQKLRAAVADVVKQQADAGIAVVTDGEFGKLSWNLYVMSRLSGLEEVEGAQYDYAGKARTDFAQYYADAAREGAYYFRNPSGAGKRATPVFTGPIRYIGQDHIRRDIENLKAALPGVGVEEAFM